MRKCNRCLLVLPDGSFYAKTAKCKPCQAQLDKGRLRSNSRSVSRNDTDSARARKRAWAARNKNPAKEIAYRAVRSAIEKGLLPVAPKCEDCGESPMRRDGARAVQAHHYLGYERPLDVKWLCPPCHSKEHDAARKEGK